MGLCGTTQDKGIHRNSPQRGRSCPYVCGGIVGRRRADPQGLPLTSVVTFIRRVIPSVGWVRRAFRETLPAPPRPCYARFSPSGAFVQDAPPHTHSGTPAFNPSLSSFLFPSDERRDFLFGLPSLWNHATVTQHVSYDGGGAERAKVKDRHGRHWSLKQN